VGIVLYILGFALNLYGFVLLARVVIDLIQVFARDWRPRGFLLVVCELVYSLTDPPINLLRRIIPPLRLGTVALDLGFIVLYMVVQFLSALLLNAGRAMIALG
jgi:YggT family protein